MAISTVRISTIQIIEMLDVVIKGREMCHERNEEIINLIIPLWKWQYSTAIQISQQRETLNLRTAILVMMPKMMRGSSQQLKQNMVKTQEQITQTVSTLENLIEVQKYVGDVLNASQENNESETRNLYDSMLKVS